MEIVTGPRRKQDGFLCFTSRYDFARIVSRNITVLKGFHVSTYADDASIS